MMPQSPSKEAPWDLTWFSQSPSAAPSYFPEFHWWSEISSLSKVILVFGEARSRRVPNLGCRGAESSGWFHVPPKNCTRCDARAGTLSWWSCQSAVARSCGLLNHCIGSVEECSSLTQNLVQIRGSTQLSHILNVTATQDTCSLSCIYHLHWPVKSSLFMHAHSSPLSLAPTLHWCHANRSHYINGGWTFSGQTSCMIAPKETWTSNLYYQ